MLRHRTCQLMLMIVHFNPWGPVPLVWSCSHSTDEAHGRAETKTKKESIMDLNSYDHIIVAFSGGKDSTACVLHILDQGVDPDKIELWHHLIDGREGSQLMDWPVTESYCRAFAKAFGLKIFFSWKEGGFEGEMLRDNRKTAPNRWEYENDNVIECGLGGGVRGKNGTRMQFPQVSADLSVRWCSAYLKIDVCTMAIRNQARFNNKRTLVVTGERAEESAARASYKTFQPDKSDLRNGRKVQRHVDHWRPVHAWSEQEVWDIIERYKVLPHPAYMLGWARLSCMACIFGSKNQWASLNKINPEAVETISDYEEYFGKTIHREMTVMDQVRLGSVYESVDSEVAQAALDLEYKDKVLVDEWKLPAGAFGENAGPS